MRSTPRRSTRRACCADEHEHHHIDDPDDHFHAVHPDTNWQAALEHAEKLGIGTRRYELIKI